MSEQNALAIRDDMSLSQLGKVFVESGFFSDTRQASQAIVKVLAGRELGFGPIASMTGVYVIQGRISLSANLLAAAIKRTGKYNFIVKQMTDDTCEIEYREKIDGKWETIGNSKFTAADAKRAQTKNMDKFPRNMLYARAMSNGARWYCPDVFGGPVYTPEELGANVTEDGDVIDAPVVTITPPTVTIYPEPEPAPNGHAPEPEAAKMSLATAENVTSGSKDKKRYGDHTTKELEGKVIGITNAMKDLAKDDPKREDYQFKLDAANTILDHRTAQEKLI